MASPADEVSAALRVYLRDVLPNGGDAAEAAKRAVLTVARGFMAADPSFDARGFLRRCGFSENGVGRALESLGVAAPAAAPPAPAAAGDDARLSPENILEELDRRTPELKLRVENEASDQERGVLAALARKPSMGTAEVALFTRLSSTQASGVLLRLVTKGLVETVSMEGSSRHSYRIADPVLHAFGMMRWLGVKDRFHLAQAATREPSATEVARRAERAARGG